MPNVVFFSSQGLFIITAFQVWVFCELKEDLILLALCFNFPPVCDSDFLYCSLSWISHMHFLVTGSTLAWLSVLFLATLHGKKGYMDTSWHFYSSWGLWCCCMLLLYVTQWLLHLRLVFMLYPEVLGQGLGLL